MELKALEHCVCVICIYVIYIYICIYVSYLYLYMYIYKLSIFIYVYMCVSDGDQGAGTLSVGLICVPYMCPYMCRWRSRRWNTFCGPCAAKTSFSGCAVFLPVFFLFFFA